MHYYFIFLFSAGNIVVPARKRGRALGEKKGVDRNIMGAVFVVNVIFLIFFLASLGLARGFTTWLGRIAHGSCDGI